MLPNFHLSYGQLLAERSDIKHMNIIERTSLWYRLERIGQEYEPEPVEPQVIEHIHRTSDMSKKEFDLLQQTARKVKYLEKKLADNEKPKAQSKRFGYKGIK